MQDPLKHAEVVAHVDTVWYCLVTVIGAAEVTFCPGHGVIVVKGSAAAAPAINTAVATEKRIVKECNE